MKSNRIFGFASALGTAMWLCGCLDVLGFKDPIADDCAPKGCTGGSTTTTSSGGTGGITGSSTAGGTGGTSGTGGTTVICTPNEAQDCYDGAAGTQGVGVCKGGTKRCNKEGTAWSTCDGQITPSTEICANQEDESCDGKACGKTLWVTTVDIKNNGGASVDDLAIDKNNNLVIAGSFFGDLVLGNTKLTSISNIDAYVIKLDQDGKLVWAKAFGPNAGIRGITLDGGGNTILRGVTFGPGGTLDLGNGPLPAGDFVAKLDVDGNLGWVKPYGYDFGQSCGGLALSPLGIYGRASFAGCLSTPVDFGFGTLDPANGKMFVFTIDLQNGSVVWLKQFKGNGSPASIAIDSGGAAFVAGSFAGTLDIGAAGMFSSSGPSDIFVMKLNNDGTPAWAQQYAGSQLDGAKKIVLDAFGDLVMSGNFNGNLMLGNTTLSADKVVSNFVAKLAFDGKVKWALSTGSDPQNSTVSGLATDSNGNVLFGGRFAGSMDILGNKLEAPDMAVYHGWFTKTGADKSFSWLKHLGTNEARASVYGLRIVPSPGDILVAGYAEPGVDLGLGPLADGSNRLFVARYEP